MPHLRLAPWIVALELAIVLREHWGRLPDRDRRELVRIVRSFRGRPSDLTAQDKRDLVRIVKALDPVEAGRRLLPLGGKLKGGRGRH